jgi:uncharacterized protein with HEPN domain
MRLIEIGEAVKALPTELLNREPSIPWSQVARMRDHLAHRYWDTTHSIVQATVDNDLGEIEAAVRRLQQFSAAAAADGDDGTAPTALP